MISNFYFVTELSHKKFLIEVIRNTYEPENARRHSYIGIILNMISTIFDVLTRPENIIYSGITFIFISIFVYYVFVVG